MGLNRGGLFSGPPFPSPSHPPPFSSKSLKRTIMSLLSVSELPAYSQTPPPKKIAASAQAYITEEKGVAHSSIPPMMLPALYSTHPAPSQKLSGWRISKQNNVSARESSGDMHTVNGEACCLGSNMACTLPRTLLVDAFASLLNVRAGCGLYRWGGTCCCSAP